MILSSVTCIGWFLLAACLKLLAFVLVACVVGCVGGGVASALYGWHDLSAWMHAVRRTPRMKLVLWIVWFWDQVLGIVRKTFQLATGQSPTDGWTPQSAIQVALKNAKRTPCCSGNSERITAFQDNIHETGLELALQDFRGSEFQLFSKGFPLGRILQKKLCVETLMAMNPAAASTQLPRPVFIVSLPRSGSTWLHNVCDVDPTARTMKSWELKYPVPCNLDCGPSVQERKEFVKKTMEATYKIAPRLKLIHHVRFDEPDECVLGWMDCFFPEHFAWGLLDMPRTYAYYTKHDMSQQYSNYKKLIKAVLYEEQQMLLEQGLQPPHYDKLILKSPHHLLGLKEIATVFPNAVVLWLHRDPTQSVGSCCSMNQAVLDLANPFCTPSDQQLGLRTLQRLSNAVQLAMKDRDTLERESRLQFVDVWLDDLKQDAVKALRKAYSAANVDFSDAFADRVAEYVQQKSNQRKQAKSQNDDDKHDYSLSHFGLTQDQVDHAFASYNSRFFDTKHD